MGLIIRSRTVGCPTEYDIRTSKTEYNTCAWRIVFIHPFSLYKPGSASGLRVGGRQRRRDRLEEKEEAMILLQSPSPYLLQILQQRLQQSSSHLFSSLFTSPLHLLVFLFGLCQCPASILPPNFVSFLDFTCFF